MTDNISDEEFAAAVDAAKGEEIPIPTRPGRHDAEVMLAFKDTNPKAKAATYRVDMSLVPESLNLFASIGYHEGDAKYGGYNYRKQGVSVETYIAATKRHLLCLQCGEWEDPKTGVPHLASMAADISIMIEGFLDGTINDDRPPFNPATIRFMRESEQLVQRIYEKYNNPDNPRITEKSLNRIDVHGTTDNDSSESH